MTTARVVGDGDHHERHAVALGVEQPSIPFKIARIAGEIFLRSELRRIDEDAYDHDIVFFFGPFEKCQVAGMEEAHGRDEADALGLFSFGVQLPGGPGTHFLRGADNFQSITSASFE